MTHSFPTRRSSDLLKPEQVKIHTLYAGGSFGRRANTVSDYVVEGAEIAKAYGKAPVRLVWTREDDVRGGRYRPMYHHALKAAVDAERSEERRLGKECVSTCRSCWWAYH